MSLGKPLNKKAKEAKLNLTTVAKLGRKPTAGGKKLSDKIRRRVRLQMSSYGNSIAFLCNRTGQCVEYLKQYNCFSDLRTKIESTQALHHRKQALLKSVVDGETAQSTGENDITVYPDIPPQRSAEIVPLSAIVLTEDRAKPECGRETEEIIIPSMTMEAAAASSNSVSEPCRIPTTTSSPVWPCGDCMNANFNPNVLLFVVNGFVIVF